MKFKFVQLINNPIRNWILLLAIILLSNSCEPVVAFDKAMPPEVESISSIPLEFIGVYMCESDSSLVYIDNDEIFKESYREFITTRDKVKETEGCSLVAGGIYLPGRKECIPVTFIGEDSISAKVYDIETLFSFREFEVAKYHKGHLFLNIRDKNEHWYTFIFTPNVDGSVEWKLVDVPRDIETIEAITPDYTSIPVGEDKVLYILSPTLVEFEDILEKEYFMDCEYLTPINSEHFYRDAPINHVNGF